MTPKARRPRPSGTTSGMHVLRDEVLVAAAITGREAAFDELVSRHRPLAVRVAGGIAGAGCAQSVTDEAVRIARRAMPSLKDRTKFSRWLLAIVRWQALRLGRLASREAFGRGVIADVTVLETLSHLACDPRRTEAGDDLLLAALERVPPQYGEVIRYHFLHGIPEAKIAELLDLPVATVKWCCFRGKEILRCILSPEPRSPRCVRMKESCAETPSV